MRRTSEPKALHSTGTIVTKDKKTPLEVFVVGATAHVREGEPGTVWKKGPMSDPKFVSQVEDAVAALESFEEYAQDNGGVRVVEADGEIRLQARIPSGYLADRTQKPAVEKAGREIDPIVAQLRKRGASASADRIALRDLEEDLVLDADTFRIKSHRLAFRFLIPYQGQRMTYSQEVREDVRGPFAGVIELPAGA
ncbi:hypothetical protein ABZY19_36875 [Streptomyces sp. NPDC006475]|uniref:hypothetical protein n=1 Tax=Streptomyces sp. NPDC006475 TaxID=3155719 RepID=UPI0033A15DEC